jgi:hypothetical protein
MDRLIADQIIAGLEALPGLSVVTGERLPRRHHRRTAGQVVVVADHRLRDRRPAPTSPTRRELRGARNADTALGGSRPRSR